MSSRTTYRCDVCDKELDYTNEACDYFEDNIAWPKGNFLVKAKLGDFCKKCATKIANENFKGDLLAEALAKIKDGNPAPLA